MTKPHNLQKGDLVRYSAWGKIGGTGVVVDVHTKKHPSGGVRALVKARWDKNGHVGTVEDRALVVIS